MITPEQRDLALTLARRWKLSREDLNIAAAELGVRQVTDEEWAEISSPQ